MIDPTLKKLIDEGLVAFTPESVEEVVASTPPRLWLVRLTGLRWAVVRAVDCGATTYVRMTQHRACMDGLTAEERDELELVSGWHY